MTTEGLRVAVVILTTASLFLLWATTLLRWRLLPAPTRHRGVAFVPVMVALDLGAIYALVHHLPLNKGLWVLVPALIVCDAVWAYSLTHDVRRF